MDNPLTLNTRKACGVLGAMVRGWAQLGDDDLPDGFRREDPRTLVTDAIVFREMMRGAGLEDGTPEAGGSPDDKADFWLRPDVAEVELITRHSRRATLLLPDRDLIRKQEALAPGQVVMVPEFYLSDDDDETLRAPDVPAVDEEGIPALRAVKMGNDPLRGFLDPYLAAYLCTQCK
ncbi:MAG: hypothetical protein AAF376_02340 [Pseudomonadota bacterium]